MESRRYWLNLFTGTTWREFLDAGGKVTGFRETREATVRRIKEGDYLLCYMTGISRWIGVLKVVSEPFHDRAPIWSEEDFPWRIRVSPLVTLTPETAVPVQELREQLSIFRNLKHPNAWTIRFRGSPAEWDAKDALAVIQAIEEAAANPVERPVDPRKLARRPRTVKSPIGPVTIPDQPDKAPATGSRDASKTSEVDVESGPTEHTEIQGQLLWLGAAMGYDVWVARNDRSRSWRGQPLTELPRLRRQLPRQFDEGTTKVIELIDVLWLDRNAVVAAFEVERTSSIYSGLLRMSDLIALQPNLTIRLYLVAPDARRNAVMREVGRPTFRLRETPLEQVVRYISFSSLREGLAQAGDLVRHLKVSFLEDISEPCTLEEP